VTIDNVQDVFVPDTVYYSVIISSSAP